MRSELLVLPNLLSQLLEAHNFHRKASRRIQVDMATCHHQITLDLGIKSQITDSRICMRRRFNLVSQLRMAQHPSSRCTMISRVFMVDIHLCNLSR